MWIFTRVGMISDGNDAAIFPMFFLSGHRECEAPPSGCHRWKPTRQIIHYRIVVAVSNKQYCVFLEEPLKENASPSLGQVRSAEVRVRQHQALKWPLHATMEIDDA